jgi:hypothetical protein
MKVRGKESGIMECPKIGVREDWSNGVLEWWIPEFAILHHSNTPVFSRCRLKNSVAFGHDRAAAWGR